jgi:hypothetical protein
MTDTPAAPLLAPATDAGDMREKVAAVVCAWQNDMTNGEWPAEHVAGILGYISSNHSGDCRKEPWSCMRCQAEEIYRQTDRILSILALQPSYRQGLEDAWQPIETAPKQARPIDLWGQERERYAHERIINCYWHESGRWVHPRTIHDDETDDELAQVYNPTHWRLPPEPPAIRALGAG